MGAARSAVPRTGLGLARSAAGARGGGTPRCHAAAPGGPRRPAPRLPRVVPPLRSLPGAARRAAGGPGGPRDRSERGNGGAIPGAARLVHAGALRMAAAVPRLVGLKTVVPSANQRSRTVTWSQVTSQFYSSHFSH